MPGRGPSAAEAERLRVAFWHWFRLEVVMLFPPSAAPPGIAPPPIHRAPTELSRPVRAPVADPGRFGTGLKVRRRSLLRQLSPGIRPNVEIPANALRLVAERRRPTCRRIRQTPDGHA